MSQAKRILIICTSTDHMVPGARTGVWLDEFAVPYEIFSEAGAEITVASPEGGDVPIEPRSLPSTDTSRHGDAIQALLGTRKVRDLRAEDFDAVFAPGGHGPMYDLATDEASAAMISALAQGGGQVAAVCHGPAALIGATDSSGQPLVAGRQVAGFTNTEEQQTGLADILPFLLEDKLRELGGDYSGVEAWQEHVVTDGNLITGQNPTSSATVARTLLEALG
ncbi:type 1 glutamine amidotransferase domain-containing protein [Thiohalorhabdus methylotrophus]|uniref:Type 1 glutamine amidotransferase domain-containing protein n=1 Tax=Thiohalorhabdus methylotrophus TaxID=3242694 RepID=A0ABV4U244_9GAMM